MAKLFHIILKVILLAGLASPAMAQEKADPPWSQADQYYDPVEMEAARKVLQKSHGDMTHTFVMADRLEIQAGDEATLLWDMQGWFGTDENKLWIKSEGDYSFDADEFEEAEIQALWSHAITPFWDLQAGVRYDLEPKGRTHAVLGIQGLAPYWFEIDAAAFLSNKGDLTARIEAEYDMLITRTLILQPRAELEISAQDIAELGIGSGVSGIDAGIRLRYEAKREFAPYVGVEWQKAFGDTADFIAAEGGDADAIVAVAGIRTWF